MMPAKIGVQMCSVQQPYAVPSEYTHMLGGEVVGYKEKSGDVGEDLDKKCDVEKCIEMTHGYLVVSSSDNNNI